MTKRTTPKKNNAQKDTGKKGLAEGLGKVEPNTLQMIIALKIRATEEKEYQLASLLREIEKAYHVNERDILWVKNATLKAFPPSDAPMPTGFPKSTWTKIDNYKYEYENKVGEKKEIKAEIYNVELPETLWENKSDLKETVKKVINTDRKVLAEKIALELLKTGHFVRCRTSLIKRIKGFFGIDYTSTVLTAEERLAEVAINHTDALLKAIDKTKKI